MVTDSTRVTYRSGIIAASDLASLATGHFDSTLRPKGAYAWPIGIRTFVTIPGNVTGIWEVDLREKRPFRECNHFLITFRLNPFSLAGAKSGG